PPFPTRRSSDLEQGADSDHPFPTHEGGDGGSATSEDGDERDHARLDEIGVGQRRTGLEKDFPPGQSRRLEVRPKTAQIFGWQACQHPAPRFELVLRRLADALIHCPWHTPPAAAPAKRVRVLSSGVSHA